VLRRRVMEVERLAMQIMHSAWFMMLQGRQQDAEAQWDTACTAITTGCAKYQDRDWLLRIRRCALLTGCTAETVFGVPVLPWVSCE
jgi:hypothetical protein